MQRSFLAKEKKHALHKVTKLEIALGFTFRFTQSTCRYIITFSLFESYGFAAFGG